MKRILTLFTLILSVTLLMGQELTVKNFALDPTDLTASTQRRNDLNGDACALIKVQLARPGAEFLGNVRGDTPYSNSVYMVYMTHGSKFLEVRLEGYLPVKINFTDYGYSGLESLSTYVLSITLPNVVGQSVDDGKTYFTLTVTPKNAVVQLDDKLMFLESDGTLMRPLERGNHTCVVSAEGYATKRFTFNLGTETRNENVVLESTKATLKVTCATSDAEIYINDKLQSPGSSNIYTLSSGIYIVEARKKGYHSQRRTIELSDSQSLEVSLPALTSRTGTLDVAFRPIEAEVWIDGKKRGTSPNKYRDLSIGDHKVEVKKDGYESHSETVNIKDGETTTLRGSLVAKAETTVPPSASAKQTFTANGVSFTMVRVEGGTFTMGATKEQGSDAWDNEKPAHQVTLSTFSIGETEVTQELWEAVMGRNPSRFKGSKRPVECVTWNDCQEFIRKLNETTGKTFRLPTEAEWEYAARGGNRSKGYKYAGSNSLDEVGWFEENSGDVRLRGFGDYNKKQSSHCRTHPVAQKKSNELGLYDMSGNVWEWCQDRFGDYSRSSQTNPKGPETGESHIYRGGSWDDDAFICRSSKRGYGYITSHFSYLGLRLVLSE